MRQRIDPAKKISGKIRIHGDKSVSHRALMLAAIAEGSSQIVNLNNGADVGSTILCLRKLGVKIEIEEGHTTVQGRGLRGLVNPGEPLSVGNSGTTIRLLSGILAGQGFTTTVTGDESIQRRPMARIAKPLSEMGAGVRLTNGEFAPIIIEGGALVPIKYKQPVASAQVKSCLMFAGLYADGETDIQEPATSRDHTERMLSVFGTRVRKNGLGVSVTGPAQLRGRKISIPGDFSSAAFFIAAATLLKDSEIVLENVGINPTRRAFLDLIREMGANVAITNVENINNEPVADICVKSSHLKGVVVAGDMIPQLIDEIPILAVLATQAEGKTEIRDAGELRHKESDRLNSIAFNLRKMGAEIIESEDGFSIYGSTPLKCAELDSFKDHRIAMAFAVAALLADEESVIKDSECVDISYPGFFEDLKEAARG